MGSPVDEVAGVGALPDALGAAVPVTAGAVVLPIGALPLLIADGVLVVDGTALGAPELTAGDTLALAGGFTVATVLAMELAELGGSAALLAAAPVLEAVLSGPSLFAVPVPWLHATRHSASGGRTAASLAERREQLAQVLVVTG